MPFASSTARRAERVARPASAESIAPASSVARGSGALLGVVVGVTLLGERLAPLGYLGVALLLGGTLTAAFATASRATVAPALLAGCAVAGYSALDRVGVRTGPAWLYAWALWTVCAVGLVGWRAIGARVLPRVPGRATADASADPPAGASLRRSLAAGLLIIGTYMLILLAFQIAPLAGVAPLREATTILAAAWGVIALREREHAGVRLGAAGAVAAGAILLAAGG